jgi:hypothetical protein
MPFPSWRNPGHGKTPVEVQGGECIGSSAKAFHGRRRFGEVASLPSQGHQGRQEWIITLSRAGSSGRGVQGGQNAFACHQVNLQSLFLGPGATRMPQGLPAGFDAGCPEEVANRLRGKGQVHTSGPFAWEARGESFVSFRQGCLTSSGPPDTVLVRGQRGARPEGDPLSLQAFRGCGPPCYLFTGTGMGSACWW